MASDSGPEEETDVDALVAAASGKTPAPLDDPEARRQGAVADDAVQTVRLKKTFARALLIILGIQLLLVNAAFFVFGFSKGWDVSDSIMLGWMGATVVEVIGTVLVVVRNLFPSSNGSNE